MKVILNKAIGGWGYNIPDDIYYEYAKRCDITIYKVRGIYGEHFATIPQGTYDSLLDQTEEDYDKYFDVYFRITEEDRLDSNLIDIIEHFDQTKTSLRVVDIPDDMRYYISDYDGFETLHEEHRRW